MMARLPRSLCCQEILLGWGCHGEKVLRKSEEIHSCVEVSNEGSRNTFAVASGIAGIWAYPHHISLCFVGKSDTLCESDLGQELGANFCSDHISCPSWIAVGDQSML